MNRYELFDKEELPLTEPWPSFASWDLFISCFNASERVSLVFDKVVADEKHWMILNGYGIPEDELPRLGRQFKTDQEREGEYVLEYMAQFADELRNAKRVCIDITGFVKPFAMALIMNLVDSGIGHLDFIYSEPLAYASSDDTKFSDGSVLEVRQVEGFEGIHRTDTSSDALIIGVGYDNELVVQVAQDKDRARKFQMFGFPPLKADMYQQNVLRARLAADAVGAHEWGEPNMLFAPANDPFVTAEVLSGSVGRLRSARGLSNLYLSPLATEAQALGFTLFYMLECRNTSTSMIFPFCASYPTSTSRSLSRVWLYSVDFN